jgi:hypothetical protein
MLRRARHEGDETQAAGLILSLSKVGPAIISIP